MRNPGGKWGWTLFSVLLLATACDAGPLATYPGPTPEAAPTARALCVPLGKRKLTIPLAGGLASNIDDKLLPRGKLLELQNTRVGRLGEVVKRTGTEALGTGLLGTSD